MPDVTFSRLIRVLGRLGFAKGRTTGHHQYFEHDATKTFVVLPPGSGRQMVPAATLTATRISIIGRNVASQAEIDELLFGNRRLQSV